MVASTETRRARWAPAAVLAAGLAATAIAGALAHRDAAAAALRESQFAASEVLAKLEDRVKDHEQVLWAGAGLFDAVGEPTRAQWRAWVERSGVDRRLPGLQATSFVRRVTAAELAGHEAAVRREGFPDYRVFPAGERPEQAVVLYLEPFSGRNLRAFGFDDLSEPVRREALERARDRGVAAMSGRIRLVQEAGDESQAGALMAVPVYRRGAPTGTVAERRAALLGWVVGAYRFGDLMQGILGGWERGEGHGLRLALHDGDRTDPETLLYDSAPGQPWTRAAWTAGTVVRQATALGRPWTLRFGGAAAPGAGTWRVWATLGFGATVSLLLFGLASSLLATGRRAAAHAERLAAEVRDGQQRLELAVEAGGLGVWAWDLEADRIRFNERVAALLGEAPGALDGPVARWSARVHPADLEEARARLLRHLRGEAPAYESEHRVRHADGGWIWLQVRGRVLARGPDGAARRAAGVMSDVTALQAAQAALQESEERFRRTADTAPVLIWSAGPDGGCDYFNRPWLEFTGRALEEELGDGWVAGVHPEDLDRCLATYRAALAARRPFSMEYRLRRHDGEHRWIFDRGVPRLAAGGAFCGFVGACTDVTEIRRAREELERSLDALRTVEAAVEQAPTSIVITDPEGRIEWVNPAFERITGWTRTEVLGQNPRILKSGRHDAAFYAHLWSTLAAGRTWEGRLVSRARSGALFTEQAVIAPVKDQGGAIRHFVAVKRDISQEVALEQQLAQAQRLESVGRLAGGVAHDFNNLLTVVLGCSSAALAALEAGGAPDRVDLEEIQAAGERARDLTRQLLAFARKQATSPVPLELGALVRGCERLLRRTIGEDVELEVRAPVAGWRTMADPGQLEQVIVNLAINARDAMSGGGRLTLETGDVPAGEVDHARHPGLAPGDHVRLAVEDTGAGIPEAIRDRIFEPFFSTKEVGRGTGLGLATVYGIVQQHGGSIHVDSQVGRGSRFEILLPRTLREAPAARGSVAGAAPRGSERLLLVEDDPAVRETLARALREGGYQVAEAAGGSEALARAASMAPPPELVITDVVMPGMDGWALAETLRTHHPGLPVLFVSGHPRDALAPALAPGADFLAKPFDQRELLRRVRGALDRA